MDEEEKEEARQMGEERKTKILRATDGLECMILHLVLMMMMMMIRKHNTRGAVDAALLVPNSLSFHKTNNPGQTRTLDKERESTHRQLESFTLAACCWDTGAGPIGF